MEKYVVLDVIYKTEAVKVSKCNTRGTNIIVCIKELSVADYEDASYLTQELLTLYSLKSSPYFVEMKEFFFTGHQKELDKISIVTEYFEKGDLSLELKRREKKKLPFTDKELLAHFTFLIDGFAELQMKNISHRDIKPENIFIDNNDALKIGDLGSCNTRLNSQQTIVGTYYYMSPEVRGFFEEFQRGNIGPKVNYDTVRSDVWSLGVTFLYMISLKPVKEFGDVTNLKNKVDNRLREIKNRSFASLLEKMLQIEPRNRWDFTGLKEFLMEEAEREIKFQAGFNTHVKENQYKAPVMTKQRVAQKNYLVNKEENEGFSDSEEKLSSSVTEQIRRLPGRARDFSRNSMNNLLQGKISAINNGEASHLSPPLNLDARAVYEHSHEISNPEQQVPPAEDKRQQEHLNETKECLKEPVQQAIVSNLFPDSLAITDPPQINPYVCIICKHPENLVSCSNCHSFYHQTCLYVFNKPCIVCRIEENLEDVQLSCGMCTNQFSYKIMKSCNHRLCEMCQAKNLKCIDCSGYKDVCEICGGLGDLIKCEQCFYQFHRNCLVLQPTCCRCGWINNTEAIELQCSSCSNKLFPADLKLCKHFLCKACQETNRSCKYCFQFELFHFNPSDFAASIIKEPNLNSCCICKSSPHKGSCCSADTKAISLCPSCNFQVKKLPNSFIARCETCYSEFCTVCSNKFQSKSHKSCAYLYSSANLSLSRLILP